MSYFVPVSTAVRDAFLGEDATAKFVRVVIDPAGTPVTFVPIDLSCDASEEYQKWSFTLKNRAGLSVGLYANEPCVVQVSHNNSDWVTSFTGFVSDDGFSRIRGALVDDYVSLELVDATKRKGTKRKPSLAILSNFKTANLANTATSILHYLASQMGASVETSDITQTHEIIEIGKKTVWAELQSLRDAFHADMYFRFDGKLLFRSPLEDAYSAPASEWTFQGDPSEAVTGNACRIVGKLSEAFLAVRCNYAKTSFVDYEQLTSRVIYKHTHNIDEASGYITVEIAPNSYWPGPHAGDVAKLKFADPESGEDYPFAVSVVTPAIGAYGSGSAIEATGGNLTLVSFNGSTSATSHEAGAAQIILYNNSSSTCTLRKLTITGEPYRKESDVKVEHVDASVSDAIDYVEQSVDGSYMVSSTQAFDTLYHIVEEGKGRPRRFGFSAPFMPWIQRRAIVMVQPPGESVVRCRIDTYSHKKSGRTLQGMRTAITCTELGTHVPSGSPSTVTIPTPSPSSPPMPSLSVRPSSNVIIINNRNGLTTAVISFTLSASAIDAANVTWAATDGTLTKVDDTQYTLDCSTVSGTSSTITVSASYNATVYQFATTVTKVYENLPVANLRGVTTVPTTTPDGDGLITGDYFLWAGATDATYTKGEIYEYNGTEWVQSTNGDLVMTMFDSFADLANDVDSTVIGNAVIKKLVAIDAFIKNLQAQNLKAGAGTGAAGSGFRFRAMDDDYSQEGNPKVPRFDVMYDNKKLFEVVATGTDAGDVIIGDYANGNGIKYDKSAGKFSVKGTIEAGSLIPFSNIRNGLGQDGNNNNFSTFGYTTTPGYFPEGTSGSFGVSGSEYVDYRNDDFIPVDTTKAYTLEMWAMATEGISTTVHYLFYACYDANKNHITQTSGGTYNYLVNGNLSSDWTKYSSTINGIDGGSSPTKFRPGTAFIKVGCLFNYSQDAYHELYIAGITLREATPFSVDGTAFQTANGKVKIYNDGTIEAVDGNFTGNIIATSGLFKGTFDTTALRLEPGDNNGQEVTGVATALQAKNFYDAFIALGLAPNTFYKVSTSVTSIQTYYVRYPGASENGYTTTDVTNLKYIKFYISGDSYYIYFYDANFNKLSCTLYSTPTPTYPYPYRHTTANLTITVSYGGDKLILSSDVPTIDTGLVAYQIYLSGDTLKVKLP